METNMHWDGAGGQRDTKRAGGPTDARIQKYANQNGWEARELATSNQLVMYKVEIDHTDDGVKNAVISWLKEGLEAEFFDVTSAGFEAIQAVAAEYWITNKGGQRVAKGVPILVAPPGRAKGERRCSTPALPFRPQHLTHLQQQFREVLLLQ